MRRKYHLATIVRTHEEYQRYRKGVIDVSMIRKKNFRLYEDLERPIGEVWFWLKIYGRFMSTHEFIKHLPEYHQDNSFTINMHLVTNSEEFFEAYLKPKTKLYVIKEKVTVDEETKEFLNKHIQEFVNKSIEVS